MKIRWIGAAVITELICVNIICGELFQVDINVQNHLHIVDDAYISFAFDTVDLISLQRTSANSKSIHSISTLLSPAYIKLHDAIPNGFQSLEALFSNAKWLNSIGLTPIIAIPYSKDWTAKSAIRLLGAVNRLGPIKCIWQLGNGFKVSDPIKYLDDLATLREISNTFNKDEWGVIGADISAFNTPDEAQFYVELSQNIVDSIGWTSPSLISEKPALGEDPTTINSIAMSKRPIWINIRETEAYEKLNTTDAYERDQPINLDWVLALGTRAQQGFSVLFKPNAYADFARFTFDTIATMLHKKLMGTKVFETQIKGNPEKIAVFAHCSRNISGAFTMMAVNLDTSKHAVTSLLPTCTTGFSVKPYILSSNSNGIISLNDKPLDLDEPIDPQLKTKKMRRMTRFVLPANSIGFWVFSEANLTQCQLRNYPKQQFPIPKSESLTPLSTFFNETSFPNRQKRDLTKPTKHINSKMILNPEFNDDKFFDPMQEDLLQQMEDLVNELEKLQETKYLIKRPRNNLLTSYYYPNIVATDPQRSYELRQQCKKASRNFEQQCLRNDIQTGMRPNRRHELFRKRTKREVTSVEPIDIRNNIIPIGDANNIIPIIDANNIIPIVDAANKAPTITLFNSAMYWQDAYGIVHEIPLPVTLDDDNQATAFPTKATTTEKPIVSNSRDDDNAYEGSPKFMRSFSKSVEGLLDIVNQNVAAWWTAMS